MNAHAATIVSFIFFLICSITAIFIGVSIINKNRNPWLNTIPVFLFIFGFVVFGLQLPPTRQQKARQKVLAQKAKEKVGECKALGDRPIDRTAKVLVLDLDDGYIYSPAQDLLGKPMQYFPDAEPGAGPVTVFLVADKQRQQVGTYSISGQPAYREWVDVYVIQFRDLNDGGTAVAAHEVLSLDPAEKRPVQQNPGYGNQGLPLAEWIRSLPTK
jgi:hypothetical protein